MSDVMSVQQKEGKLRVKPSHLGKIVGKLPYGTKVTVVKKQGAWYEVKSSGLKGWLHKSSLTEKTLELRAGNKNVSSGVSDDELALAGKGFNNQAENGDSNMFSVQQKEGKLRSKPSFLGKIVSKLPYATRVSKVSEQGAWYQVKAGNVSGWMHKSSLTEKVIILKAGDKDVASGVSDDELVLAGKGFNSDVEKSYKQENPNLNYALVDKMEQFEINLDTFESFVKEGGLPHV